MSNVSPEAASAAASLTAAELAALEESGQITKRPNFGALASVIGLSATKLEIAKGWQPTEKDLSLWRELRVITTTARGITVNCYLLWDEVSREAALFDTGWEAEPISKLIQENHSRCVISLSLTPTRTISPPWAKFARHFRKCGCIRVPKTRRWTSGIAKTISFTSAASASPIATRPGMPKMA